MSGSGSTTHMWVPGDSGFLYDATNYEADQPFVPGDTLVVTSGTLYVSAIESLAAAGETASLYSGTYEFQASDNVEPSLTLDGIELPTGTLLSVTGTTQTSLDLFDVNVNDGVIAVGGGGAAGDLLATSLNYDQLTGTPSFENFGTVAVQDASDAEFVSLDVGPAALFDNEAGGVVQISGGSTVLIQSESGALSAESSDALMQNDGTIEVTGAGSTLVSRATLSGSGTIVIDGAPGADPSSTTVELQHTSANDFQISSGSLELINDPFAFDQITLSGTVTFEDGDGVLEVSTDASLSGATIEGFQAGDVIRLDLLADDVASSYDTATETLTVTDSLGVIASLHIAGDYQSSDFSAVSVTSDFGIEGDVVITTTETAPCFVAGTLIDTPRGLVPVERLEAGDLVALAAGGTAPVTWIGRRRVQCAGHPDPASVRPVRIRAGRMADGLPRRDLLVSPDHALFVDGVLVPAGLLVDGAGIVQEPAGRVSYFHVELATHAVILAEGLPAETYLDTGNRDRFANAPIVALRPRMAPSAPACGAPCAEMVLGGARLERIRAQIAAVAAAEHGIETDRFHARR